MEITEVRVALHESHARPPGPPFAKAGAGSAGEGRAGEKRLKAYATLTSDSCFVVRNIKIIEGKNGLFVAMPSRKPKVTCGKCAFKVEFGGRYCTQCGSALQRPVERTAELESPEAQAHRDIAHPITVEFRQYLQRTVLDTYEAERIKGSHLSGQEVSDPR